MPEPDRPSPDPTSSRFDPAGLRAGAPHPAAAVSSVPPPRRRWKTRVLLPAAVAAAFLAIFLPTLRDLLGRRVPVRVVPVVTKAGTGGGPAGTVIVRAAGWIEPDPFPVTAAALQDGVVAEVLVLEGAKVEAGQVLARLVPDDARLALARAEAEVAAREAALAAAQADWDNPVERTRAVETAEARERAARADAAAQAARVAELEEQLRREKVTAAAGATAAFDVVRTGLQLETAKAEGEARAAGAAEAAAELKAAREGLRLRIEERRALDEAKAEADRARAMRDEARLAVDRLEVRAPVAGVVMRRMVAPGSGLMRNGDSPEAGTVALLYDPARMQVRTDVPLADAAKVSVGQEARVEVEVLPGRAFAGVVTRIVHEADLQKNTLQAKVAIRDPDPALRPEMLARVGFLAAAAAPGAAPGSAERVFVLERALLRGEGGSFAWVVDAERKRVSRRAVTPGSARDGEWIEAASGLRPGDLVVEGAPPGLADGDRVEVVAEGGR